jgi:hypothetical protein
MVTDANGNVYTIGAFRGTVSFGNTTLISSSSTSYLTKWSPDTNGYVWARQINNVALVDLAIGGNSVYLAAVCTGTATFGSITNVPTSNQQGSDVVVAKFTVGATGPAWNWVHRLGGTGDEDFAVLAANGPVVYVSAQFNSPTLTLGNTVLTRNVLAPGFVARLNDLGSTAETVWGSLLLDGRIVTAWPW